MRKLFGRLRRREGQSLVLFAILMPTLLVFAAFGIDGAHAFVDYRHLQNTADATALAAAQDVGSVCTNPAVPSCLQPTVTSYSGYNSGPASVVPCDATHKTNCYQWPYIDSNGVSQPLEVLVKLQNCTTTFFGGIVGVASICESVRSVAKTQSTPLTQTTVVTGTTNPGTSVYGTTTITTPITVTTVENNNALFASDMTCGDTKGISFDGNNATVSGFIHSNGSINLSGNDDTVASASYGQTGGDCGAQGSSYGTTTTDTTFNSPPLANVPWPADWTNPGTATICAGATTVTTLRRGYAGGTYCNLSGNINVQGPPASGKLTVVAQSITVSRNGSTFPDGNYSQTFAGTSYGLLFYATTGSITISGNNDSFPTGGSMFAPSGTIDLKKNGGSNGFWEAEDIIIAQNNFTMTGQGPGGTPTTVTTQTVSTSTSTTTVPGTTQPNSTSTATTGTSTTLGLGE